MPYCRKCYADLHHAPDACPSCGTAFDPADPKTFLARPFPGRWTVVGQILFTTLFACLIAFIVALFQIAGTSGH